MENNIFISIRLNNEAVHLTLKDNDDINLAINILERFYAKQKPQKEPEQA